jgi:hypothetical protein
MNEFKIKGTPLVADSFGNLYNTETGNIINAEHVKVQGKAVRTKAVLVNVYLENGRYDLIQNIDKPVYLVVSPKGARYLSVNLSEFSRDLNLDYENLRNSYRYNRPSRDGWMVVKIN